MKNLGFKRICRKIADVAIYAHYPESFCSRNLAIWKVFAFSDSAVTALLPPKLQRRGLVFERKLVTVERVCQVTMNCV